MSERGPAREDVEELARRLWEAYRDRRVARDSLGRPNYVTIYNLARRLLRAAYEAGIEDPLHSVDWLAVVDPDLSADENYERFVEEHPPRPEARAGEEAAAIEALEREIEYLRGELERAGSEEERREIEEQLRRAQAELEAIRGRRRPRAERPREERPRPAPRPAPPPPPPPPAPAAPPARAPEERTLLWIAFSAALEANGISAEAHRREFEEVVRETEGMPFEQRLREVIDLARSIIEREARPPPAPGLAEVRDELRALREEVARLREEVRRGLGWRPSSPEEVRMLLQAAILNPPGVTLRTDPLGCDYVGPDQKTMDSLRIIIRHPMLIKYFEYCPANRLNLGLPGGGARPTTFVEDLLRSGFVSPLYADWLRQVARLMEEGERRGLA